MPRSHVEDRKPSELAGLLKRRVLIVDDNLDDLLYYSAVLYHHGFDVRSIGSYRDGATCLDREDFDLIIVSQGSASFEGRCVLARAIEKDRHTPVLVVTRSADMPCYLEAIQSGALDYIEKPLSPSEIGKLVRKYLRTQPGRSGAVGDA